MNKYWIGVASKDHVENGVKLGICQFCHGKSSPAKRLRKGDFVIYYSSKHTMGGSDFYQKFTAIGVVKDDAPYQVEMENGFKPFRRNIDYLDATHLDIKPLIPILPFIKNKSSWEYVFRYGFLEIDQESFDIIASGMLGFNPLNHAEKKMNKSPIWDISTATKEEAEFVDKKLIESIRNQIHLTQETILKNYIIKDEGNIIAGINTLIMPWGILYIDVLFVDEDYRYKGLGTALLKRVEDEAKAMGAALSNLTSFDFQARDFYIKQGYEIFGVLEGAPEGHTLYFLKKRL